MAHTQKHEIEIVSILDTPEEHRSYVNGPVAAHRFGSMKERGKRKQFYLDIKTEALVFDGWDCPLQTDSEVLKGSFSGNACFNLGGMTPAAIRLFIDGCSLNGPVSDEVKAKCVYVAAGSNVCYDGELLWPQFDIAHAVVNRMKEKHPETLLVNAG